MIRHMVSHGFSLHRAARHVPLVVRGRGAFEGGRGSRAMQGDDPETKARLDALIDGIDASPLIAGIQAVFDGRMHYLTYTDGRTELYDVSVDPDERENLAAREPAQAARMDSLLRAGR